ncbi:hypothetical protein J4Q44_G00120970 [Coregonus suidteri]|uniref:THD domain-containing protein n=1 Tax=Coregonus suidteri TaxID=861788 RepID=A0AAN8LWP4_9TELE
MAASNSRRDVLSKLWVTMFVVVVVVLQVASTTGLLFLNMSVAQVRSQGVADELRCLGLLNALEKDQEIPDSLVQLFGEPCIQLAEGIRAYITKSAETNQASQCCWASEALCSPHTPRQWLTWPYIPGPSERLASVLPPPGPVLGQAGLWLPSPQHDPVSWTPPHPPVRTLLPVCPGVLPHPLPHPRDPHMGTSSYQLVQCVYKKTSYARPIQLLKGVGTKCWAPDTEYALHSVYQGGLFELRARDEIFASVSSPTAVHAEDSSSYFGAFQFDQ